MFRVSGCCLLLITLKQTSDIKLSMKITTYVNAGTTLEARKGKRKSSAVAFRSGAVKGFLLAANGLLLLSLIPISITWTV